MIPADVDPSLRPAEPLLETLDGGFSPPVAAPAALQEDGESPREPPAPGAKSPF